MQTLNGFIKVHRKLIQWGWYQDHVVKDLFLHLLLTASFKESEWMGRTIQKGQLITSYGNLANELGFSVQQIRTAVNKLKSTGEITTQSTNRFTIITVVNWGKYQVFEWDETSETTSTPTINQQTDNKQATNKQQHRKKDKNEKNVENGKNKKKEGADAPVAVYYLLDAKLDQAIRDFINFRKKIKAPMTERAIDLMMRKLDGMTQDNNEKIAILEQSIMNGWKSVYPLKQEDRQKEKSFYEITQEIAAEEGDELF